VIGQSGPGARPDAESTGADRLAIHT
jgi:hypothetical protein